MRQASNDEVEDRTRPMGDGIIRVVELFAGVGGFSLGLERASPRYRTVWANQWEPGRKAQHAFDCLTAHFGNRCECVNEDIAVAKAGVPEHELLVGGFPCQDYSVAATNAKGITGKKGVLWWEIRDVIAKRMPPYVLLENVDRLLRSPASQRGRDFGIILRCLFDLSYSAEWRVINAADYGHPQKRRRTFIMASHSGTSLFEKHQSYKSEPEVLISRAGALARAFPVEPRPQQTAWSFADVLTTPGSDLKSLSDSFAFHFRNAGVMVDGRVSTSDVAPSYNGSYTVLRDVLDAVVDESLIIPDESLGVWRRMKGAKRDERRRRDGSVYYYTEGAIPYPDNLDGPARTLLTSESSKNRSTHIVPVIGTDKIRLLSPEECERLNGFPVGWTKAGGMPQRFRYFVMGNALVVGVIESIGRVLATEI